MQFNYNRGFTLIELVVVIALIGALAIIMITSYSDIRAKARDTQRKSDLRQIQTALELYKQDVGSYPIASSYLGGSCPTAGALTYMGHTYLAKIPCDPLSPGYYNNGNYNYNSTDGLSYTLVNCLENGNDPDPNKTAVIACNTSGSGYGIKLTNPQ